MKQYSLEVLEQISSLHKSSHERCEYPRFDNFKSAIYDIDKRVIFSTFEYRVQNFDQEFFIDHDRSYYIAPVHPYYLGGAYIVIEKESKDFTILSNLIPIAAFVVFITIFTAYFLARAVLKPIRANLMLLDDFIRDTTHELNTPITTILANIDLLDMQSITQKNLKKIERIKIAALSISNLYEDLVYLVFNHQISSKNEELNLSKILKERIDYFTLMASSKKIVFESSIMADILYVADQKKIERLIDNILSNAIKYSKHSTTITVILESNKLSIKDEGKGMSEENVKKIYEKYSRFDNTQGGFGIGYSIIGGVIKEYSIDLHINTRVGEGTKVTLSW